MELRLFALQASRDLGKRVADALCIPLTPHEEREFEDGEHKSRPLESVRGQDVYVVHSLYGDARQGVDGKLVRLLLFIGALKESGAGRVTAVVPYLCYTRKDRKTKPRDPVSTRYVATLFEAVGADRVVTLDVHNPAAYQNAFRLATEHLEARKPLVAQLAPRLTEESVVVVSPDVGGIKRAEAFRQALEGALGAPVDRGFMEKQRSAGVVSGEVLVGNVEDRAVVIVDDMIGSGTTLARAVTACRRQGAARVYGAATHGLFAAGADDVVARTPIDRLVVTDTIPPFRLHSSAALSKLEIVTAAPLLAEAIRRLHTGGSLVELLS